MARTYTRAELRTRGLRLANHENDLFVSAAEANDVLDDSYARLWKLLLDAGMGYNAESVDTWVTDGITAVHTLPSTFGSLNAIEYSASSQTWVDVPRAHERELADFLVSDQLASAYRLDGATVVLYPRPSSGKTYRARYFAAPAKLASDGATVDGAFGYERLMVLDLAIYVKVKEEADARALMAMRQEVLDEIEKGRTDRVFLEPGRVRDLDDYRPVRDAADWGDIDGY